LSEGAGVRVVSVGGPTETTLWNIWHPVDRLDPERRSIPYGTPIANTRYRILDDRMRDRPVGATGEMYCSGVGVARGYWDDPERTAASFMTHPRTHERLYRTGDRGRFLADGSIEFIGRADFQVKVNGHRI
ncbi:AMP-binding protein, partial [Streptomyces sp. SID7499]|nr:AMP-binding protein [Streptomyces sp. SID7499]